jgi:hypothetical protein
MQYVLEKQRCPRFAGSWELWYTCCMTITVLPIFMRNTENTESRWKSTRVSWRASSPVEHFMPYTMYKEQLVEDWRLAEQHAQLKRIPPLE